MPKTMPIEVVDIRRYPVKGLSAEPLERVVLSPAKGLPNDRRFAIAHGTTDFDPEHPAWLHKSNFLTLLRDEKLARLRTRFDDETGVLTIERDGEAVLHRLVLVTQLASVRVDDNGAVVGGDEVLEALFAQGTGDTLDLPGGG